MDNENDPIRQFVISAHFNLEAVKKDLADHPEWLEIEYDWGDAGGTETPLQAAAHVANADIAHYLLEQGAAMLGDRAALDALINHDPANANLSGAHGITLLTHAAFTGDIGLLEHLLKRGTRLEGVSTILVNAASVGDIDIARWALAHGANKAATNYKGQTAADLAREGGFEDVLALLDE
jgi:ankyrin repeat protein